MDIDQAHFPRELLTILKHISTATFVTFDLEMSGINTRQRYGNSDRSLDAGKPTLQQQYTDMKSAAETFQVVQVGLTCVQEDQYYLARPYNFNLSPLSTDKDVKLERTFSFSSSACDFLQRNHFDFGRMFRHGVPYLSRKEEDELREEYMGRANRNSKIPDVVVSTSDPNALAFQRNSRDTIKAWLEKDSKTKNPFVNITQPTGPLNAYQRRLIYQLVRNEFPELRVFAKNDGHFMQAEKLDVENEEKIRKRKLEGFNKGIAKQVGLRWIFEALSGGDLSAIDPKWLCPENSEKPQQQLEAVTKELNQIKIALRKKSHVVVGHNLFTDLGFLYKTFIGFLPSNVKHFQQHIHELFPLVIDTKYLATHGHGSMGSRAGLKDLLEPFKKVHTPLIVLHEKHTAYGSTFGKEHEAGFDSWMTAELFTKLSAKLYAERETPDNQSDTSSNLIDASSSDNEDLGGALLNSSDASSDDSNTPGEWHAREMNRTNPFFLLDSLVEDGGSGSEDEVEHNGDNKRVDYFVPRFGGRFWDIYMNKLRVNAVEAGVCDLSEGVDEL
ncbi:ribonuclease H-like domain-containing protein [Tricladium varicosporioides]|nr:ribonuclease H-like domain-containing protein [Hymenoscyphus varicosporioides]